MSIKSEYKEMRKLQHKGPGGLKCSCCNPYGESPRFMKPKSRRLTRRVKKQQFKKEMDNLSKED